MLRKNNERVGMSMGANKFQVVHRLSEVIAQTADPWNGLNQVTKLISDCVDGVACALFAYNKPSETLSLVAAYGVGEDLVGKLNFSADKGLTGLSVKTGSIINVDDQRAHCAGIVPPPPIGGPAPSLGEAFHGLLIVPLVVGGSTIGAIVLTRVQKRKFSKSTLDMIQEIAPPLAIFIVNAMLVKQTFADEDAFALQRPRAQRAVSSSHPLRGKPITGGVVCGHAIVLSGLDELLNMKRMPQPVNTTQESIEAEIKLFNAAQESALRLSRRTAKEMAQTLSEANCEIFELHAMLLEDPTLKETIMKHIREGHSITTALAAALKTFSAQYMKIQDVYLRERFSDIKDVLLNLKNASDNLRGMDVHEGLSGREEYRRIVVVAHELLPSQLVSLPLKKVVGIICEDGGSTSHVSILARALQKSMLVGVQWLLESIQPGDSVLMDCDAGNCYVKPTVEMMHQFYGPLRITRERQMLSTQSARESIPVAHTSDGAAVHFAGNLSLLSELPAIPHYGLEEIGLYRTEFMFMIRCELPTEDEQYNVLKRLVEGAGKAPVTIRVLDAGGDKPIPYLNVWRQEDNPAIGWRGLRFLLSNPQILGPHLRAILRAASHGTVNILFPMVGDLYDLLNAKEALHRAEEELRERNVPFCDHCSIGIMLEIPSAVWALRTLLPHIDFVSIGTNDLVQFLFAVDRGNPHVNQWYRQCHPVLLRAIQFVCRTVSEYPGKTVSICGELAGSRRALPLLLGAGLRKFSMTPSRVSSIRDLVAKYDISECEELFQEVLDTCGTEKDVMERLAEHGIK